MQTCNQCIFTGQVRWHKEKRPGNGGWGFISTRFVLPKFEFEFDGSHEMVQQPFMWLNIKTSYAEGGLRTPGDKHLAACQKEHYAMVHGGVISDYEVAPKDENSKVIEGAPMERRYKIEVPGNGISFSETPLEDINTCIFSGLVTNMDPRGWMTLRTAYQVKGETRFRHVEVLCSNGVADQSVMNNNVFVMGQVCGKQPNGEQRLYVVADRVVRM